jgi:hypothetical protein
VAVLASLACFGGCWAGLAAERVLDTGSQVGVASVPLVVVLTVLGAWAERAREKKQEAAGPGDRVSAGAEGSPQSQVTGQVSGGIVIGPGSVVSLGDQEDRGKEPLRDDDGGPDRVLVVGDVPQEPAAFQPRAGLTGALEQAPGSRVSVVFAVMGIRGVGKTQLAAAYARRRIAEGWRLVAWVDAGSEAAVLAGLAKVAAAARVDEAAGDARTAAVTVRHWLEGNGARRLLVFDNAADVDGLRPFLPGGGAAQVVITSSRRPASGLGTPVPVDVFTETEALAYLAGRTGLEDMAGARELAGELGFLPLGLAQAAALIARENLGYGRYLERLRALPVARYLERAEGDAYPYRTAEAIMLSLRSVEDVDPSGRCAAVMGLVALLAEAGASRRLLHTMAAAESAGDDDAAVVTDAVLGRLTDASLVSFTLDDSVVAHRLVMRVVREQLAAEGRLIAAAAGAAQALDGVADEVGEIWQDRAWVRELAMQITAVHQHAGRDLEDSAAEAAGDLLRARGRALYLLNELGDSTGQAISTGQALLADQLRVLGDDHPDTLASRGNLAGAYESAGRLGEAIPLLEQNLTDRLRVLSDDHPSTLTSRGNLAYAYRSAGRLGEAIPLLEQNLTDRLRVLSDDHPSTLTSRNNLAGAYESAGRLGEAIPLLEQNLTDSVRVLGDDHPDTLTYRGNLAAALTRAAPNRRRRRSRKDSRR